MNIAILGISEMRWQNSGNINIENHKVFYSRSITGIHEQGVSVILTDKMARSVKNFIPISTRIILVQLLATPVDVNNIQVYAPTADKEENGVEEFYSVSSVLVL